jgi:hypothetical protein
VSTGCGITAHVRVVADDAWRVAPQRRGTPRSSVDEDHDALRASIAGVLDCGEAAGSGRGIHLSAGENALKTERAKKGHRGFAATQVVVEMRGFLKKNGSSGWTRTSNPPVNRLMQVVYPLGSSVV